MSSLNGKVALITGGSKGAGLGIAKAYVKEGVAVAITGRNADALAHAKAELEAAVLDARVLADNKDHEAAARVVSQAVEEFGRLNILIDNAQEFRTGIALEDLSRDDMISTTSPACSRPGGSWRPRCRT
ncbi:SDR family NAD(P)-dependent oxidoreductase [Nonomuraea sp. NPDC052116]|uniref:SDR family NAD(P)-dependent oxidoreductase n=1 Tax=Nonomuraea sp. NPDC052116 TaxID=3155665 RepID=UPI0034197B16